jgi:ABC-type polysaccharide/polyol phosphate transport system ATPase subunit
MLSDDVAICAENLTKRYRLYDRPLLRLRQALAFGGKKYYREFTAIDDLSFEIRRGETVGIIGRNGSGKSTLLQSICGILKPTAGKVRAHGRVSALLELGAGFHPEFTGRENVYMQGAIMGIPREQMASRFAQIEAFADIGQFIDRPVKTYSSGMFVRLAFSVAIHVKPDILIVDEALSVGDVFFQQKSINKIRQLKEEGVTILFVSHSLSVVKSFCSKTLYLKNGSIAAFGDTKAVCLAYQNESTSTGSEDQEAANAYSEEAEFDLLDTSSPGQQVYVEDPGFASRLSQRSGSREVEIVGMEVFNAAGEKTLSLGPTPEVVLRLHLKARQAVPAGAAIGILISNRNGVDLAAFNSEYCNLRLQALAAGGKYSYEVKLKLPFSAGAYSVHAGIKPSPEGNYFYDRCFDAAIFEIKANPDGWEHYALPLILRPKQVQLFQG